MKVMTFDIAIERTLAEEGGYVNNPADPGGETKWGISKRSYPDLDIANLTRDEAKAIYKRDFWDVTAGQGLDGDIAFQVLDFAVNSGAPVALQHLQRAVGVADDGYIGPATIEAVRTFPVTPLIFIYLSMRLNYMTRRKNWPDAGKGWAVRISDDMLYAAKDLLS